MYANTAAAPRADISTFLEEAINTEKLFVGQQLMPIYSSPTEIGRYPRMDIGPGELLRARSAKRGNTGTYSEIDRKFTWDLFQTEEYGLEERIDDVLAKRMENFFDVEVTTGKLLMRTVMLDYEIRVASTVMNPANVNTTQTAAVAYTEANLATFDFPRDIQTLQENLTLLGETPNMLVMSLQVYNRIRRSLKMQQYLYGSISSNGARAVTEQQIADAFGFERVIVTRQSYNMAAKGLAASIGPIWGNGYVAALSVQGGDFQAGGYGRTIIWDADTEGGMFTTESYRAEPRRGNMVRVRSNYVLKVLSKNSSGLVATNWA